MLRTRLTYCIPATWQYLRGSDAACNCKLKGIIVGIKAINAAKVRQHGPVRRVYIERAPRGRHAQETDMRMQVDCRNILAHSALASIQRGMHSYLSLV